MSFLKIWKGFFSTLSLITLTSCGSLCDPWVYECSQARIPCHSSGRIYLCASNEFCGLELELVHSYDDLRMYINVFGLEIPPDSNDPLSSRVYISFKDHSYTFSANRFAGGQRLLIPDQIRDEIIDYLICDQPVFIRVGRYEADIYPQRFMDVYNRLMGTCF